MAKIQSDKYYTSPELAKYCVEKTKEIIKNIDDNERVLLTMPELKYVHNVKEIEINPLNTENEVIDGVVLIGCKYC